MAEEQRFGDSKIKQSRVSDPSYLELDNLKPDDSDVDDLSAFDNPNSGPDDIKEKEAEFNTVELDEDVKKAIQHNEENVCETVRQWLSSNSCNVSTRDSQGMTALHYAAEMCNAEVTKILLENGADPNLVDEDQRTALHCLCYISGSTKLNNSTVATIADLLIEKVAVVDAQDADNCTALHYAARNHHFDVAVKLLNKGADMTIPDEIGDTPIHMAAESGNHKLMKVMIERKPECVTLGGYNDETPLHQAVEGGHLETVKVILASSCKPNINAKSKADETPLHFLAVDGSLEIGKLLLKHGAQVNPPSATRYTKTPFHKASFYGQTDLALFLLENGAKVTPWAFQDILSEGYEAIARAVVESPQWPIALRGIYKRRGKYITAFRELIMKMPAIAELVLNKCTVEGDTRELDDRDFSVLYNYEFIEDCNGDSDSASKDIRFEANFDRISEEDLGLILRSNLFQRAQVDLELVAADLEDTDGLGKKRNVTYGCSYQEIIQRNSCPTWGPSKFTKADHPLQIMVERRELKLLKHPVVASLLHYKWKKFGLLGYLVNLLTYVVFLIFLTTFALLAPNSQSPPCNDTASITELNCPGPSDSLGLALILSSVIVLLFGGFRLAFEIVQLVTRPLSYIRDWVNWVEIIQYTCSIIFVVVYGTKCFCVLNWQWQVGVVAVFFGWIGLILFVSKLPFVGIYVIILIRISITFFKMLILTILLIVAFGLTFFMIFFDSTAIRSPFSDVPRSLMKTMTMTTGEFDYDTIFRLDPTGESDALPEIQYPPISYILWITFIVFMPVILTNMLTSLAVGDTNEVKDQAQLEKLALQVDQVLSMEEFLFFISKCLRKKWRSKHYREVYPNQQHGQLYEASFKVWEGDRYDRSDVILKVIRPQKDLNEEVLEKTIAMAEEIKNIRNELRNSQESSTELKAVAQEVMDIKETLHQFHALLKEISRHNGAGSLDVV